jgi:preprotein translocase subunit SecE
MNYKDIKDKVINYLREIKAESKKVVWPGRQYVTAATIIVFIIVFLVVVYVMVVDFCFARFFSLVGRSGIR